MLANVPCSASHSLVPRCRHRFRWARICPSFPRTMITDSSPICRTRKSAGLGNSSTRATHSQQFMNISCCSRANMSADKNISDGSVCCPSDPIRLLLRYSFMSALNKWKLRTLATAEANGITDITHCIVHFNFLWLANSNTDIAAFSSGCTS